ncbi:MAG: polyprenol monophosphomannose synthase [Pirellulales bacterium]|nr:polyprenol monophosphomannose synthase [Pirellulales bacterium]
MADTSFVADASPVHQQLVAAGNPRVLVMTATYNEIENLPALIAQIHQFLPAADVLIVDDNSPDGTGKWGDTAAAADTRIHVMHRAGKQGLGTAIIAGMQWAIARGYDYVINVDADFSHHPRYLPDLVAGMAPATGEPIDVMIGSRYVAGGGVVGWPLRRHLMSRGVNLYARWLMWLSPRDCSGGYRCYRVSKLAELDFSRMLSRGYSFQEEILWRLRKLGARFGETPITFADREKGVSKINNREALNALGIIARLGLWGG